MDQNMSSAIAKKFWNIIYFMLRKSISKNKLLSDLNRMMKRGNIAGKAAIHNLIFRRHYRPAVQLPETDESDDFSCCTSPAAYPTPRRPPKKRNPSESELLEAAFEMACSAAASPAFQRFGRTPVVRITDSPFPLREIEEDNRIDEAAEKFISKFYRNLRKQNGIAASPYLGSSSCSTPIKFGAYS